MHNPPERDPPPADDLLAYALADAARLGLRRRKRRTRKAVPRKQDPRLSPAQRKGLDFEDQALELLVHAGLQLLARNLRVAPGEIDLVMRDGNVLVLVEVRARANARYGGAGASIDPAKQRRLTRAAAQILPDLARRHWQGRTPAVRFDAVLFDGARACWLRHAFAPE
ncbi:YraN family protein [Bordetella sp. FB-8]|uniref:YraN family protein n=1 Tax=Bordetella sp. FB-8 TaxID=1159870 RepID=UPI0003626507|nr:YraN family protein [Bordetella sp. FB-8]